MSRPALVVVDRRSDRRRALSTALSEFSYEVVPALDAWQAAQFVEELGATLVVAATDPDESPEELRRLWQIGRSPKTSLLFLAGSDEQAADAPDEVFTLSPEVSRSPALGALVERVRLILLGRELGLTPDVETSALVGDLSRWPFFSLLPRLERAGIRGRLELPLGEIALDRGAPIAANTGKAQGVKAFCRLGVASVEGLFRLVPEAKPAAREIEESAAVLLARAVEDSLGEGPRRVCRVEVRMSRELLDATLLPLQAEILAVIDEKTTVGSLLDGSAATDGETLAEILRLERRGFLALIEPPRSVRVVTDSASDLSRALLTADDVRLVPLTVHFGERSFRDGVDITSREFYDRLERSREHPSTRPPSIEVFESEYRTLRDAGAEDIVSVHISSKMSLTWEHAREAAIRVERAAALDLPRDGRRNRIFVVDTLQCSLPIGFLALFAARMARRGVPAESIVERLGAMSPRVHSFFVVDTLEYLARGGRIGRARAWVGQLLGIKPILGMAAGEVAPFDRARGGRAAQRRLVELMRERVDVSRPLVLGMSHANAPIWAERLHALLRDAGFQISELLLTEMGPIVGAHVGPGTVGAVVFQPTDEERDWVSAG